MTNRIEIYRTGQNGNEFVGNGRLENSKIVDCPADILESHYEAVEKSASTSDNLSGVVEVDSYRYSWTLTE